MPQDKLLGRPTGRWKPAYGDHLEHSCPWLEQPEKVVIASHLLCLTLCASYGGTNNKSEGDPRESWASQGQGG